MPDSTVKPRRSVAKRWMLAIGVLVAGLLLLETGTRIVLWLKDKPYSSERTAGRLRYLLSPIQAFVPGGNSETLADGARRPILNPYYGGEDEPDTGGVLAYFRDRARPEDYEVVLVGGSVAALLAMKNSAWIEQTINADPRLAGRRVVLLNAAHPAYKQPQQLNRVTLLLTMGYRPEAVVLVDGFNEVTGVLDNNEQMVNPVWPTAPIWSGSMSILTQSRGNMENMVALWELRQQAYDTVKTSLDWGLHRSAVLGTLTLSRLEKFNARRAKLQSGRLEDTNLDERIWRQVRGPKYAQDEKLILATGVRAWAESSRTLRAACESRGIHYLHVLQPALFDTGAKPLSPEERVIKNPNDRWLVAVRDGYPLLRAEGLKLAAEGQHYIDGSHVFADVTAKLYYDPCHFGPEGIQILSAFLVRHFLEDALPH